MIRMTRFPQIPSRLALLAPLAVLVAACGSAPNAPAGTSTGSAGSEASPVVASGQVSTGSAGSDAAAGAASAQASTGSAGSDASEGAASVQAPTGPPDSDASPDSGASPAAEAPAPSLGSASTFAVLGASTVTCANLSAVTGNVGVSPGTAITGFDPGCTITGTIHAGDAVAAQAQADLAIAYGALSAVACQHNLTGQDLGGQTLAPGVYCFDTTAGLTGALTLDGGGDSNATWIFQIGTAITTGSSSSVVMAGSGTPGNVFWHVGSSATIAIGAAFQGNILASASITLVSGSSLVGRALALNAAVTSDDNAVSLPQ